MGNVDERDNWKVHFSDTMRAASTSTNWRMASCTPRKPPDRVRRTRAWGAVFDRTKDGKILQRNFGATLPPASPTSATGTGLELIRTYKTTASTGSSTSTWNAPSSRC